MAEAILPALKTVSCVAESVETCIAESVKSYNSSGKAELANMVTILERFLKSIKDVRVQLTDLNNVVQNTGAEYLTGNEAVVQAWWLTQARKMAFSVQDTVDEYLYHSLLEQGEGIWSQPKHIIGGEHHTVLFYRIIDELIDIKEQIGYLIIHTKDMYFVPSQLAPLSLPPSLDVEVLPELTCTDGPMDYLLNFLMDEGVPQRKLLSIVGLGGVGKTILAYEMYRRLRGRFECFASVVVSRRLDRERTFRSILLQICPQNRSSNTNDMNETDLICQIVHSLKNKRYIILIDDLWDAPAWSTIKSALPDDNCGSRVMVTTRLNAVASSCCPGQHDLIYELKPLSYLNSKRLFLKGASSYEGSSTDAPIYIPEEILKICSGMPLAITSIRSQLTGLKLIKESHKEMSPFTGLNGLKDRLFLSCSSPPYGLDACSLYLSMFPEKHKVERVGLVRKWIAEGFTFNEEVANEYFDELINRNVIQLVEHGNSVGEEDTYEIHPMMLYVLKKIAQVRNFATCVSELDDLLSIGETRRLSIQFSNFSGYSIGMSLMMKLPHLQSMIFSGRFSLSFLLRSVIHLQVLDMEGCTGVDNSVVDDVCGVLLLLRYLGLNKTQVTELPPQIGNLGYLETLDLRQTLIATLPQQICKLQNLESLDVRQTRVKELPEELVQLPKLARLLFGLTSSSTLRGVRLPAGSNRFKSMRVLGAIDSRECSKGPMEELIKVVKELRELAIVLHDGPTDKERNNNLLSCICKCGENLRSLTIYGDSNSTEKLASSPALDKLKVPGRFAKVPRWIEQLSILTLLEIRVCKLQQEDLRTLGDLRCLRRLALALVGFPREQTVITDHGFARLAVFSFDCCVPWLAFQQGAMPSLKHLELRLYAGPAAGPKVPSGIVQLQSLNKLVLRYSLQYASSARVTDTVSVIRDEAANHANLIVLSINGEEEIYSVFKH